MSISSIPRGARRALLLALALLLLGSGAAAADSTVSTNWAGYAVHRGSAHFSYVAAQWRIPAANCSRGNATFSSMWVGLGGYADGAQALEQTGTDSDCSAAGRSSYSAWYELVPANSASIHIPVRSGDLVRAVVSAAGGRITIRLSDLTRRRSFQRTLRPRAIDLTSAEWILEAPSQCGSRGCRILPLTDFGRTAFGAAYVRQGGHGGRIRSRWWNTTSIILASGGRRFVSGASGGSGNGASPSGLSRGSAGFSITYSGSAPRRQPFISTQAVSLTPSQPVQGGG